MSFQVTISGHSSEPHNEKVREAVQAAVDVLKPLGVQPLSISGYSNDSTGSVSFTTDDFVPVNPAPVEGQPTEESPSA